MLKRSTRAMLAQANTTAHQSAAVLVFARDTISGFITTAHHTVMILGITAMAALALMFFKPDVVDHLKALSPFTEAIAKEMPEPALPAALAVTRAVSRSVAPAVVPAMSLAAAAPANHSHLQIEVKPVVAVAQTEPEQKRVTSWISKKYRVSSDATNMLVATAFDTAREIRLDPLLILAVMAIESGFNPFAESPVGAQGLMQVMSKIHHDKFVRLGGVKAALNPVANIRVGSLILKDYVTRGGSVEAGLKLYVGASAFDNDAGYGSKVIAEYKRLKQVALGRSVSEPATASVPKQPVKDQLQSKLQEQNDTVAAL